jgi:hypothetical protein
MKWAFVIDVTDIKSDSKVRQAVQRKAEEASAALSLPDQPSTFRASVTFYQSRDRWLRENPAIPREDIGRDLDNLIKAVFDGLGPIVGWRQRYERDVVGKWQSVPGEHRGVSDACIVEVTAKKLNSGSDQEFLSVEIELGK